MPSPQPFHTFPLGGSQKQFRPSGPRCPVPNSILHHVYQVCAFSNNRFSGSVFGARCPALGVDPVPVSGPRCQVAGTRYPVPGTWHLSSKNLHTEYASRILYPHSPHTPVPLSCGIRVWMPADCWSLPGSGFGGPLWPLTHPKWGRHPRPGRLNPGYGISRMKRVEGYAAP